MENPKKKINVVGRHFKRNSLHFYGEGKQIANDIAESDSNSSTIETVL